MNGNGMKRTITLLLAALLLVSALAGCGAKTPQETPKPAESSATPAPTPASTPAPTEEPAPRAYAPDGSVLFEKDGLKVTTAGLDQDPTMFDSAPIIWLDVENTGGEDACLGVARGAVNGIMSTVVLVNYYEEDGEYCGGDYTFELMIPAGSSGRYALGYYKQDVPGVEMDTLGELELCFTLAEDEDTWPDYFSEPVTISTGEVVDHADFSALGTTVVDNEQLRIILGAQDYSDFFGPYVYTYTENKSEQYLGLSAEAAEADGIGCDYVYYGDAILPGKLAVGTMCFSDEISDTLKGFESLTVTFAVNASDTAEALGEGETAVLEPVTATYPPQIWGEYENGGLSLEIRPRINDLITVETPENDENGILFTVSETASLEAGGHEGAGLLGSIGAVSEEKLHELLCWDMSGMEVFAKDDDGNYYVLYQPTDVRYERATSEEMQRDADQWSMLCAWVSEMRDGFCEKNGLEYVSYGNSEVEMYVSRAAWDKDADCYLATTEFMDLDAKAVSGTPYADFVLQSAFWEVLPEELPDEEYLTGENLVLGFPGEEVYLHFYPVDGGYVVLQKGETETIWQAGWYDDRVSVYEAMLGWYYAVAEKTGVKAPDRILDAFCGDWHEKIAGRGTLEITKSVAPGKAIVVGRWPGSAFDAVLWEIVASLDGDGNLAYENGHKEAVEYDEDGSEWTTDETWEESGRFSLNASGELLWQDDSGDEESVFVR